MTTPSDLASRTAIRKLADQACARAAGASLVGGNSIRLLKDARENYPAWLDAISCAQRSIHFESYIIHDDDVGEQFADALLAKARGVVRVRVIYDWMGGFGKTSRRFWNLSLAKSSSDSLRSTGMRQSVHRSKTPSLVGG